MITIILIARKRAYKCALSNIGTGKMPFRSLACCGQVVSVPIRFAPYETELVAIIRIAVC
jgi:hypothetical protein